MSGVDTPLERHALRWDDHTAKIVAAARCLIAEGRADLTIRELTHEAQVAFSTFYRRFTGMDELLLAVLTDIIAEDCTRFELETAGIDNPVDRLKRYVMHTMEELRTTADATPQFLALEFSRLDQQSPHGIQQAQRPVVDLIRETLDDAKAKGLLKPSNAERAAWFVTRLISTTYHHYANHRDDPTLATADVDLWQFCLRAVGGAPPDTSAAASSTQDSERRQS